MDSFRIGLLEEWIDLPQEALDAGGVLQLHNDVVKVISLSKNGVLLTAGADYEFARPRSLKLLAPLLADDRLTLRAGLYLEDVEIQTIAAEVRVLVDSHIATRYALPLPSTPPVLKEVERQLVRGRLLLEFGPRPGVRAGADDALNAKSWMSAARATLQALADGNLPLLLADGTRVETSTPSPDDLFIGIQNDAQGDAS